MCWVGAGPVMCWVGVGTSHMFDRVGDQSYV